MLHSTLLRSKHIFLFAAMLLFCASAFAQQSVQGKITDSAGNAVSGATIVVKGGRRAVVSNASGEFSIAASGNATLIFSSAGYQDVEVPVGGRTSLAVTMLRSTKTLSEVVVTALGVKREKRNLTYSTQQLSGDEIARTREPNLVNAVAGKIAGVQVTSSSGEAGASSRIVIRGASSATGDNQALFVVDGIPINNDETGTGNGNAAGAGVNRVIDIDPSTIESINVLKGAAATALYGSSGARGVVLITTKNGMMNKAPVFTVSTDLSSEKPILPRRQTSYSLGSNGVYADGNIIKTSSSWGARMDTLRINGQPAPKYNPYDFFRTGITSNSVVSVAGGGATSSYFLSYSYYDQSSVMPGNDFKRSSLFAKYNNQMGKYVNTTFQLGYSNSNQDRLPEGASNGPLFVLYDQPVNWNPYPVLDSAGNMRLYRFSRNAPLWDLDNIKDNDVVNRFLPVFTINVTPAKWLTITERAGADMYSEQNKYYENPQPQIGLPGKVVDYSTTFRQFNNDLIVNASKTFGKFNVNLLLGNNIFSTYSQNISLTGNGITIDQFYNTSTGSSITASEAHYLQRKVGFYTQANIEYNRFLNLSLTGRYDGSSVLATQNNFYPYGSAAASFIFSELLNGNLRNVINYGKIRFSAATVGNDGVGPYSLSTPYNLAGRNTNEGFFPFPYQGQGGFLLSSTLSNPTLKNERLDEYEGGLEFRLFQDRVSFEGSYFYRKSHDGIIPGVSISNATGYSGTTVNTASIENKGIELLVGFTPAKMRDFRWDLNFNFTSIRNKVLALYPGLTQLGRIIVGQPFDVFYGVKYKRNSDGQMLIDANGLPVVGDQGIVGSSMPDWLGGMENTLTYKQFSLSFFFDMKMHGDVQNDVDSYGVFYGTAKQTENRDQPLLIQGISIVDNKPNTVKVKAQTYWQSRQYESEVEDGTYIKLRNVTLAYHVSPSALSRTPFKSATVVLSGRNLWIYSPHFNGADPEVSSYGTSNGSQSIYAFSTPTSRSLNVSLKFSF